MRTKRLTVRQIVEDIQSNMPEGLSENEKITFITTRFAQKIASSEHYYWGDRDTRQKMIQLAQKSDLGKYHIKRRLIPFTMTEKLGIILQECGYKVKYDRTDKDNEGTKVGNAKILKDSANEIENHPLGVLVQIPGEKHKSELNIELDLYKLQTRCKPRGIGEVMHSRIPGQVKRLLSDSESTFRRIYGLKDGEKFTDEYIDGMIQQLKKEGKKPFQILKALMADARIQQEVGNAGCVEANRFYNMLLRKVYCVKFDSKAYDERKEAIDQEFISGEDLALIDECVLDDGKKKKRYSFCIYAEHGESQLLWVYSKKTKKMIRLTSEEICKLSSIASHIKPRNRDFQIKSRENVKAFMEKSKKSKFKTKKNMHREPVNVRTIFGDEDEEEELEQ